MIEIDYLSRSIKNIKDHLIKEIKSNQNSNKKAEVVLLVYQRPHNLKKILKSFSTQTDQNFSINILNNNVKFIKFIDEIIEQFPLLDIKHEHSKENVGPNIRFDFACKTIGNPILFLDDDMIPETDFVEYSIKMYNRYGNKVVLGWHSFQFMTEDYVTGRRELLVGEVADNIGTGSCIIDKYLLNSLKELKFKNIPEYIDKAKDDMWLSYILNRYGYKIFKIDKKVNHIIDGLDTYNKIRNEKKELFLKLRKKGWSLIREKIRPKVHILVTTYNSEDHISDCINSIKKQDYDNFECIIIDDGSTDNTSLIIKSLIEGDKRFKTYKNTVNYGAAYSRYQGFKKFKAENNDVCMYIDGDDYLIGRYALNRIIQEYDDPNCWFTYGSLEGPFSSQSGEIPKEVLSSKDFRKTPWVYHSPRTYKYFLLKMLKKEDFLGPDGNFLLTATDMKFTYHLLELCGPRKVRYIPNKIYFYREHDKNSWKTFSNKKDYRDHIRSLTPFEEMS